MSPPPTLHHLLLTTHPLPPTHNPQNTPEKLRCPGTYTTLPAALATAHKALFDLGYERGFFALYEVLHPEIPNPPPSPSSPAAAANPSAKALHATTRDGSVFQVHISSTPNTQGWEADFEDGRVGRDVYLAVQTRVRAAVTYEVRNETHEMASRASACLKSSTRYRITENPLPLRLFLPPHIVSDRQARLRTCNERKRTGSSLPCLCMKWYRLIVVLVTTNIVGLQKIDFRIRGRKIFVGLIQDLLGGPSRPNYHVERLLWEPRSDAASSVVCIQIEAEISEANGPQALR